MAKGSINVTAQNIFPIIKKFLYSDHEIFLIIGKMFCAVTFIDHLPYYQEVLVQRPRDFLT